jgi:hypothetical protein
LGRLDFIRVPSPAARMIAKQERARVLGPG